MPKLAKHYVDLSEVQQTVKSLELCLRRLDRLVALASKGNHPANGTRSGELEDCLRRIELARNDRSLRYFEQ